MQKMNDKVVLITGGARGLGASHVKTFIQEGANVVFTDLLEDEGQALAHELGSKAKFISQDVTKESDWLRVIEETENLFGPIDVLVNNAGIGNPMKSIAETSKELYQTIIDVNQLSVFLGMKSVLTSMKKTKNGSIINVSSLAGLVGARNQAPYVASKFAVRGLTKAAALEFVEYGIRVNSVHPGPVMTTFLEDYSEEDLAMAAKNIPIGRFADPQEVTDLVIYLASDESKFSTGSEFVIDGGISAQ